MRRVRDNRVSPISKIVERQFRKLGAEDQLFLFQISIHWREIVGERLAKRSFPKSLKNGRLVVNVSDSGWMTQLKFLTRQMKHSIKDLIRKPIVTEIFLVVGDLESFEKEEKEVLINRNLNIDEKKLIYESTEHVADPEFKEMLSRIIKKHVLRKSPAQ